MPDTFQIYQSELTGPELDEALKNIALVQQSVADAAQSAAAAGESAADAAQAAQTAETYGAIVQQNQPAIQDIADNLAAVQNAAANAQAAAASAAAAQQAAQEALGFRTFFSAVTPDKNGDLDPSRPMTTPTAASVTVKSKGDRIQSVEVDGFTTQAGTGDPSPTNVREISTAGLKLVKWVVDGVTNKLVSNDSSCWIFNNQTTTTPALYPSATSKIFFSIYSNDGTWGVGASGYIFLRGSLMSGLFSDYTEANAYFAKLCEAGTPFVIWYTPADESQATGLYIPIQAQGHEYRCQCLELTAELCDGDKVESCVPSGCDKRVVFDGSQRMYYSEGNGYVMIDVDNPVNRIFPFSTYIPRISPYQNPIGIYVISGAIVVKHPAFTSLQAAKEYLAANPLIVWYRSTAYTEANDIPVQLETHQYSYRVLTGTESGWFASSVQNNRVALPLADAKASSSPICSIYKAPSVAATPNSIYVDLNKNLWITDPRFTDLDTAKGILQSEQPQVIYQLEYQLEIPAVYARDTVTLVAVPYTEEDATAAQQLAETPSTLPAIDSPDVPMLLDETGGAEPAEQVMVLAANAVPVVGTYVVSSQDGTTVVVSLKAMQDGGDAATLGGMTANQILAQTPTALSAGVLSVISAQATVSSVPVGASGTAFSAALTVPDGYTALDPLYVSVGSAGAVANLDAFASGTGAVTGTVYNLTQAELQNVFITVYVLAVKIGG